MNKIIMKSLLGTALFSGVMTIAQAGTLFTITPTTGVTPTNMQTNVSGPTTAEYTVTNTSGATYTLTTANLPTGVSQSTISGAYCASPFTLTNGASCNLLLNINPSSSNITRGPEICKTIGNGNNNPDVNSGICSNPASPLSISLAPLVLSQSELTFAQASSGVTGLQSTKDLVITATQAVNNVAFTGITALTDAIMTLNGSSVTSGGSCGNMTAGSSCTLSINTAAVAATNPGSAAASVTMTISGTGITPLTPAVSVLAYGNKYAGGYVFNMVENATSSNLTANVTGTTAEISNNSAPNIEWNDVYNLIGVTALSSTPCEGSYDGYCNTQQILPHLDNTHNYAARVCNNFAVQSDGTTSCTAGTAGCYSGWYLPSICEMDSNNTRSVCSTTVQSMLAKLPTPVNIQPDGAYWSSTEDNTIFAWNEYFIGGSMGFQDLYSKESNLNVRCARAF